MPDPEPAASPRFSASLWDAIGPIYAAIEKHPFLTGLTDGSLSRERFGFYITQDALYLREFARVLVALASTAPDDAVAMLGRHATGAIEVEQALHEGIVRDLGMHPEQVRAAELAPSCRAYTDFLHAAARGRPFHEGLAAVLPCYWIYQRVGQTLLPRSSPEPLYARWIATYGGAEYDKLVAEVLDLTDRLAPALAPDQRTAMTARFVLGSRYEWMFWDAAWRLERWPV